MIQQSNDSWGSTPTWNAPQPNASSATPRPGATYQPAPRRAGDPGAGMTGAPVTPPQTSVENGVHVHIDPNGRKLYWVNNQWTAQPPASQPAQNQAQAPTVLNPGNVQQPLITPTSGYIPGNGGVTGTPVTPPTEVGGGTPRTVGGPVQPQPQSVPGSPNPSPAPGGPGASNDQGTGNTPAANVPAGYMPAARTPTSDAGVPRQTLPVTTGAADGSQSGAQNAMSSLMQYVDQLVASKGGASPAGASTTVGQQADGSYTPSYLSSMFPNGLPSTSAPQVSGIPSVSAQQIMAPSITQQMQQGGGFGYNPTSTLQQGRGVTYSASDPNAILQQNGGPGYSTVSSLGQADMTGGTGYNAAQTNVDTSGQSFTKAIMGGLKPQFAEAQRGLDEALGAAGITGQQAIQAKYDLGLGEQSQAQADLQQPLLALKGDELAQAQSNAGATNQASSQSLLNRLGLLSADAGAANNAASMGSSQRASAASQFASATDAQRSQMVSNIMQMIQADAASSNTSKQFGASQRQAAATGDASNAIATGQSNQNADLAAQEANQGAATQAGEFDASQQSASDQFNVSNLIKSAMSDSGTANALMQLLMQFQNSDWLANLGSTTQLASGGQAGQTNAYQPVFQQPTPFSATSLMQALAPVATASAGGGGGGMQNIYAPGTNSQYPWATP